MTPLRATALALLATLASGCAARSAREGVEVERLDARWERRIRPFEARDAAGAPYALPFLGGFDSPRPQLVDIDGDGDDDLFVQEATGAVAHFENVAVPGEAPFRWRTDRFAGLDVGEWFRFADLDGDGDVDLLGESPISRIRVWENVGGPGDPAFEILADPLLDAAGEPIVSDRQNIPNVVDLDCDGRLDLMIGRLDGTIDRFEATAREFEEAPRFELVTAGFEGIRIVGQITPSARHGANTLVFHDVDGDGDRDLLWGDFFEPGLLWIENRGRCERFSYREAPVSFPPSDPIRTSGYNAPAFGDVDGDGALDLLVGVLGGAFRPGRTAADNLYRLERGESGWSLESRRFLSQIDVGSGSVPALGDIDGDGDLDLLLANKIEPGEPGTARIHRFENVGTAASPAFRRREALPIEGAFQYAPALGDLDGDGDLDLAVGTWNDGILVYENVGTAAAPRFERAEIPPIELTRGSHAAPVLADLDGDGDLDLLAGESSGELNRWRNEGSASEPRFTLVTDSLAGIDAGQRSHPALADLDGDGVVDLVVGSDSGETVVHPGIREGGEIRFSPAPAGALALPRHAAPAIADLDGDGALDLLVGETAGGVRFYGSASLPR